MAWLASVPKEMGRPRGEWIARHLGKEQAQRFHVKPGPLEWLVDLLFDAGAYRQEVGMDGLQYLPLGWFDLKNWSEMTGTKLSPTFYRGLIRLSATLVNQIVASRETDCPAPFDPSADK